MISTRELIQFEQEVAEHFNAGRIRAPVHLDGGSELELHEVFSAAIKPDDWKFVTWRSHYICLLAGVPREQLMADILAGKSITLNYPSHKIVSSAIVGGIIPIALGVALAIKRRGGTERVWCFLGDMAARTGAKWEAANYAMNWDLPLSFVCLDNNKSVCTDTRAVWGEDERVKDAKMSVMPQNGQTLMYRYALPWPHAGAGKRIQF